MRAKASARIGVAVVSIGWLLVTIGYSSRPTPPDPKATPDQVEFFETKIRPVLAQNCLSCHGKDAQRSGLRLDSLASMKAGGDSGPAIVPGAPEKSLLITAIRQTGSLKMPPTGSKLPAAQIADLETWIKMGAPWPSGTSAATKVAPLWSLQPVVRPSIPVVKNSAWVSNPIDSFVLANLEANHQHPATPTDRRTLIRRVSYDLIGLPPTEEETEAFLADKSPGAYERVVDRLLNSPHYGERQARLWMDVARYADTKGYVFAEDRNYPNAYTYRDWLINAFNQDLTYDKFIIDQLAADKLPEVASKQDPRSLAAMGFLTLGRKFLNNPQDIIDDKIDVTMRGLEGFTVGCARCHDHKFDPIPTQDYYSLYAVFASSVEKTVPISPREVSEPWERYTGRKALIQNSLNQIIYGQVAKLRQQVDSQSADIKQQLQTLAVGALPDAPVLAKLKSAFEAGPRDKMVQMERQIAGLDAAAPPAPDETLALLDSPNPADGVVFHHGNPNNRGVDAPRRFLLALSKPGIERPHWTDGSGRLELAQDIASKDNPLTARVYVNRVWQDHFGAAIVRTPSDFGHQGEKPTDPKLLDYLASTFMDDGWSTKKLNRLIVTSATYCQSSSVSPEIYNADPDNRYWGRMNRRRLDLEQLRDTMMAVSGKLQDDKVGGKSVDLWAAPFTPRRALYGFIERQNLPGIFRTFDYASPDTTSPRRFQTTVPQQALFFMNSDFAIDEAKSVASRPEISGAKDDAQRVRRLYLLLFDRLPDADELQLGVAYLKRQPGEVAVPASDWQYGFGGFDAATNRTSGFTPFAHFEHDRYQATSAFPDPTIGYLTLNAIGGHPGRDGGHAAIRRWVSPYSGKVQISGLLVHGQAQGDGVRGRIVSSRSGLLGEWQVHNGQAQTNLAELEVQVGDTLDFELDCMANDGYDSFRWAPTVRRIDGGRSWDSTTMFAPPPPPGLTRLALYVQALSMTNEFMFID